VPYRVTSKGGDYMLTERKEQDKWVILIFLMLINFITSIQYFGIPVLLPMIGVDLHLNVAMLGFIWGMWTLGGVFLALPGGLLGDIMGTKKVIFISTLVLSIACGLRGLATGATFLAVMMFIAGGCMGSIWANAPKTIFMRFPPAELGLANGLFIASAMVGGAVGAGISATIVAPTLGGWRNALFLYAVILAIVAFGWLLGSREHAEGTPVRVPFIEAISKTIRTRDVWFCIIVYFCVIGVNSGFVGYLPLYLQNIGWNVATSSASLMVMMLVSIVTSFSVPFLADRFGSRKMFFIIASFVFLSAVGMVGLFKASTLLWGLFIIGGLGFGPLIPMLNSMIAEIKGIGALYGGTAIGLAVAAGGLGGWILSTSGGRLATINQTLPFIFFSLLFLIGLMIFLIKGTTK
jgi:cyanate permease